MINVFQPSLGAAESDAVREVFESGWVGRGPRTARFEREFAEHLGAEADQVTSVNSCTEGLFLAVELLVPAGAEVVLPTVSFVGAANAVAARGAVPVFCDVDPRTLNPTVPDVERCLTSRTAAVLLLHYGGHPGQVAEIARLCRERGIALIEDAACAVASAVGEQACGTVGDVGVWSFDAMKVLVTGDGGMLWARDPELAARAARLAYLGMDTASGFSNTERSGRWWEFGVSDFARRSIMNDAAAAVGSVQLRRLPEFLAARRAVVRRYDEGLAEVPGLLRPPAPPPGHRSSHYFYWVQVEPEVRDELARQLRDRGIYTTFRYHPLHRVPAYGSDARLPHAEWAAERTLCLPLHQALSAADVDQVVGAVTEVLAGIPAGRLAAVE